MLRHTLALVFSAAAAAQVASGPEPGAKLEPIRVFAATGEYRGREFDLAAELGQRPGAILFVHTVNRETAPPMRILDDLAAEFGVLDLETFTVRLNGDRTAGEEEIARFSKALQLRRPMVLSLDGAEGPGAYALNRRCTLTLVVCKDGKVVRSLPFTDTGAKDEAKIRAAIVEVTGELPRDLEERAALLPDDPQRLKAALVEQWREIARLRQQLQKAQERNRQRRMNGRGGGNREPRRQPLPGAVPDDPELQGLMRRFNRAKTKAEVDALFTAVDAAVGDDAAQEAAMVQGFVRLLATTYGTDYAREQAKAWVDEHRDG